jgi:hypothetical protein
MSLMTAPSKMVTSAPSMANARLLAGDARGYPRDGAGMDDNRRMERRNGTLGDTDVDVLSLYATCLVSILPVCLLIYRRYFSHENMFGIQS